MKRLWTAWALACMFSLVVCIMVVCIIQVSADTRVIQAAPGMEAGSKTAPSSAIVEILAGSADDNASGAPVEKTESFVQGPTSAEDRIPGVPPGVIIPAVVPEMPKYKENGRAFYEKGDYGAAILEFNRQLEFNPDDVTALANRGLSFARRGEYKIAIENLYIALSIKKDDVAILKYLAALYYLDREFMKSIDMFDRATTTANTDFEALAGRGCAYMSLGRYEAAINDFTRTIYVASRDIMAFVGRGISLNAIGKHKASVSDLGTALSISANDPFTYLLRAEASAGMARFTNAVADLNRACALGYTAVCVAVKQAQSDIAGIEGTFVLQYSRKAPDEELYDAARKKLELFYSQTRASEINKYFVGMLRPLMD